jgi:hypothetical protein
MSEKIIDFGAISEDVSSRIKSKIAELHDSGLIKYEYKINAFKNTGEYFKYQKTEYSKEKDPEFLINIIDGGTIQDSSIPYKTYMKIVRTVIFSKEEYRDDVITIFESLALDLKSIVTTITDQPDLSTDSVNTEPVKRENTVQISNDSEPEFSDKIQIGYDAFNGSFDLSYIVFTDLKLSNNYKLWIDGYDVPYTSMTIKRAFVEVPNLPKTNTVQYYQNTSAIEISVSGLYANNVGIEELHKATLDVSTLPSSFVVSIGPSDYDPAVSYSGTETIFSQSCACKGSQFSYQYGKLIAWDATFTLAANVSAR